MPTPANNPESDLTAALAAVPPGAWGVGVSGGADSVALLRALHAHRPNLRLVVVHLDHQTRGDASTADAQFVAALARELRLPVAIARADEVAAGGVFSCDHAPCDDPPCDAAPRDHAPCVHAPCDHAPCDHASCDRASSESASCDRAWCGSASLDNASAQASGKATADDAQPCADTADGTTRDGTTRDGTTRAVCGGGGGGGGGGEGSVSRGGIGLRSFRNRQAHFRALRMRWFAQVVAGHRLDGVILAHHADDQAETVLLRLLRGHGAAGLYGIRPDTRLGPSHAHLRLLHPLLGMRAARLRHFLQNINQPWREDASNASPAYRRNIVRRWLADRPGMTDALLHLAHASLRRRGYVQGAAVELSDAFDPATLRHLAPGAACESARRWLMRHGAPAGRLSDVVCRRLIDLALRPVGATGAAGAITATGATREHFPGRLLVGRRSDGVVQIHR